MSSLLRRLLFHPESFAADVPGEVLTAAARESLAAEDALIDISVWNLPTVVAARQLVADTTAMMPMVAHNGDERLDPTPTLLRRPDPSEPYRTTLERIVNQMTRHGVAVLRVTAYGSNGYPLALEVVDRDRCVFTVDPQTRRVAGVTVDGVPAGREIRLIPFVSDGSPPGESPLNVIAPFLTQLTEVYRFSSQYYGTGSLPPYSVVHPNRLTQEQAQHLSDQWRLARAERRPAILSGNLKIEQYAQVSAADAMMLDAINYLDATVARVMGIPPSLLNTLAQSSLTYSTTEGEFRRWLSLGLYPQYLARIEAAFTDLLPRGTEALFDTSNLTRMDLAGRIDAYSASVAAGIHTTEEVRALEGLPTGGNAPAPIQPAITGL